jgi:hypothetical protein
MAQQYQVRFFQIPRWAAILIGLAAAAFAIALVLLSLTVLLIAVPILAVIGGIYYLFNLPRRGKSAGEPFGPDVIDAEYRVIEQKQIDRERNPGNRS